MKLLSLTLDCRKSQEVVVFSPHISLFHGEMATGKSSIARLIDFCLGGVLERTPAIQQELISAQLELSIGQYHIFCKREANNSNQVQVTWRNNKGISESRMAPLVAKKTPILWDDIFSLSDLIYYFLGIKPIKIPKGTQRQPDNMVRLTFRVFMWYCYLAVEKLEASFYNLGLKENPYRRDSSRFVLEYIVGLYTKKLNELNLELSRTVKLKKKLEQEVESISVFLRRFGYSSEQQISDEIEKVLEVLSKANIELKKLETGFKKDTHFVDDLRNELRHLGAKITNQNKSMNDIKENIEQKESLKAELIAAKFKMVRSEAAKGILEGANFEVCPLCGLHVENKISDYSCCSLCGQNTTSKEKKLVPVSKAVQIDLDSRIKELDESIDRHKMSYTDQNNELQNLKNIKQIRETKLEDALKVYDSKFLSQSREIERKIAKYNERLLGLKEIREMPIAVTQIDERIAQLRIDEVRIKREIKREKETKNRAEKLINELELAYLDALLTVGLPQLNRDDIIKINRTTWIPEILPHGKEKGKWNFFNIGSSGMKTLLNVCFALSLHKVASANDLPLPEFLIIDDPTKNVDREVNSEIFDAFYNYLYGLAQDQLSNTQFILIENSLVPPPDSIESVVRYLSLTDNEHPPLISYYRSNHSNQQD